MIHHQGTINKIVKKYAYISIYTNQSEFIRFLLFLVILLKIFSKQKNRK